MSTFQVQDTVGELVARRPRLSKVFETVGIDYCCGGKKTLEQACGERGLDATALLGKLEESENIGTDESLVDAAAMGLAELADHIEQTHHAYLKQELPRLVAMTRKVAQVHGENDPRLECVRDSVVALTEELSCHMMKEENILFPMIRRIDASDTPVAFHCGSLANPIRQMELEHHDAGDIFAGLHELTDNFTPPDWACNTYRAMIDGLAQLEKDMHQHIHKEDNVLFPRALAREAELRGQEPAWSL